MHAEHRGRTGKCTIANHRVDYSFNKVVPSIRMSIDKNNNLSECPMEFEILQEFAVAEKITLGFVRLNLAEYVEESEIFLKDITSPPPTRRRNNSLNVSPTSSGPKRSIDLNRIPDDGITRRYLMQDSKVNSTLKMSILLVQVDGERNFIAPPLRTAPVFGGIAGFMAPEQMEDETGRKLLNINPYSPLFQDPFLLFLCCLLISNFAFPLSVFRLFHMSFSHAES